MGLKFVQITIKQSKGETQKKNVSNENDGRVSKASPKSVILINHKVTTHSNSKKTPLSIRKIDHFFKIYV